MFTIALPGRSNPPQWPQTERPPWGWDLIRPCHTVEGDGEGAWSVERRAWSVVGT